MNKDIDQYRVFCSNEDKYVYTYSDRPPISCPNDGSHTIDTTKIASVGKLPLTVFPTTSFEEIRTAERTPIIELKSIFGKSSFRDIFIETGGTISNTVGDSEFKMQVNDANGETWLRSAERGQYVAGLQGETGIAVRLTSNMIDNQTLRIGLFDTSNGFFYEYTSNGLNAVLLRDSVRNVIPLSQFNVDKFDGSGPSKYVLDPKDGIIYTIRFSWYGFGNVEFRLNTTNAELKQSSWLGHIYNPYAITSVKNPNLPISVRLQNNGTLASGTAFVAGRQYSLLGKYLPITRETATYRLQINVNSPAAFTPLISVRRKQGYLGVPVKAFAVDALCTSDLVLQLRTQATLNNPIWTTPLDTDANDTATEVDINSTSITGGKPIWTALVGGNNRGSSARLEIAYDLPEFDTLCLIAKSVVGGNNTVSVIFRWTEGW
jgi:hypothetical protein